MASDTFANNGKMIGNTFKLDASVIPVKATIDASVVGAAVASADVTQAHRLLAAYTATHDFKIAKELYIGLADASNEVFSDALQKVAALTNQAQTGMAGAISALAAAGVQNGDAPAINKDAVSIKPVTAKDGLGA